MYIPDDNDIDRVSRDAAEHYNAPGTPSWDALRQTLDKELPQEKEKKRRGFLFFILLFAGLFVAGGAVWYGAGSTATKNQNNTNSKASSNSNATENISPVTMNAENPEKNADNKTVLKKPIATGSTPDSKATATAGSALKPMPAANNNQETITTPQKTNTSIAANQIQKNNRYTNIPSAIAAGKPLHPNHSIKTIAGVQTNIAGSNKSERKKSIDVNANKTQKDLQTDLSAGNKPSHTSISSASNKKIPGRLINKGKLQQNGNPDSDKDVVVKNEDAVVNDQKEVASTTFKDNETAVKPVAIDTANHTTIAAKNMAAEKTVAPAEKTDSIKTTANKIKSKSKNSKAILLGLTAGVDQSTIKFTYGSGVGYNIGLMGGYQFNKHWAVYTGAVYTKKNYKLSGEDFHPPKHYWTTYVNLQTVDGYCKMWEFPLEARYTFNPGARNPFFVNAGLSSYVMTKQAYDYDYKNMAGMQAAGYWSTDSTFNHPFSVLDLSFGFQKHIGKNMNLQIEPYGRVPLGGVGFGNIRLSSFGINFTVQYKKAIKR